MRHRRRRRDLAVAKTGGAAASGLRAGARSLLPGLEAFLAAGERKIDRWYAPLRIVEVDFADEAAFSNINTPQELAALELPGTEMPPTTEVSAGGSAAGGVPSAEAPSLEALSRQTAGYDPKALPVASAQSIIERFITPIDQVELVEIRQCLGRILATRRHLADRCAGSRQFGDGRLCGARRGARPDTRLPALR